MGKIEQKIKNFIPWLKKSKPKEFVNWSGSMKFTPGKYVTPESSEEVAEIVKKSLEQGRNVRVVGAGHSSSNLVETKDILLSFEKLKGITSHDKDKLKATIYPGMTVGEVGRDLLNLEYSLCNTGDVDMQNLSGAIGTGTHGTGKDLQNLSALLHGAKMVNGKGEIITLDYDNNPDLINALRVSLGSCGIFTKMIVNTIPAIKLHRRELCAHIDDCLAHLDELIDQNRNFDFYWYPRNDLVKLRTHNPEGSPEMDLPYASLAKEDHGWLNEILPKYRTLKYDEMEYALPAEAGPECFQEVRKSVRQKHRSYVGWRVLYRTVAADETYLSPFYGRPSVTIAILQNVGLPYWPYFKDIEPIFRAYGGRPHWGKKHTLLGPDLQPLYPKWNEFQKIRKEMDPEGVFMNEYLKKLFNA